MNNPSVQVGDYIRIGYMAYEQDYTGRVGKITFIDSMGQLHGTWGGLAVIPTEDSYTKLTAEEIADVES